MDIKILNIFNDKKLESLLNHKFIIKDKMCFLQPSLQF